MRKSDCADENSAIDVLSPRAMCCLGVCMCVACLLLALLPSAGYDACRHKHSHRCDACRCVHQNLCHLQSYERGHKHHTPRDSYIAFMCRSSWATFIARAYSTWPTRSPQSSAPKRRRQSTSSSRCTGTLRRCTTLHSFCGSDVRRMHASGFCACTLRNRPRNGAALRMDQTAHANALVPHWRALQVDATISHACQ